MSEIVEGVDYNNPALSKITRRDTAPAIAYVVDLYKDFGTNSREDALEEAFLMETEQVRAPTPIEIRQGIPLVSPPTQAQLIREESSDTFKKRLSFVGMATGALITYTAAAALEESLIGSNLIRNTAVTLLSGAAGGISGGTLVYLLYDPIKRYL